MKDDMTEIERITQKLLEFRDLRDWKQFHNGKDLAIALNLEAGELLELFLWKSAEEADVNRIKEELADVFSFALLLAEKYSLDPIQIVSEKIKQNEIKYPIEKSKGSNKKYTDL